MSKSHALLPVVPNLMKFLGVAQDSQQHNILNYFIGAEIPFKLRLPVSAGINNYSRTVFKCLLRMDVDRSHFFP